MFLYSTVSTLNPENELRLCQIQYTTINISVKYLLPMVGMVVTISPSFNLYRIVVLPAASKPTGNTECDSKHIKTFASQFLPINILICFFPNNLPNRLEMVKPMPWLVVTQIWNYRNYLMTSTLAAVSTTPRKCV